MIIYFLLRIGFFMEFLYYNKLVIEIENLGGKKLGFRKVVFVESR